jgi:hypothetical protein
LAVRRPTNMLSYITATNKFTMQTYQAHLS